MRCGCVFCFWLLSFVLECLLADSPLYSFRDRTCRLFFRVWLLAFPRGWALLAVFYPALLDSVDPAAAWVTLPSYGF